MTEVPEPVDSPEVVSPDPDEVSPPPNKLETKSDESPSVEETAESVLVESELPEESALSVDAEGVTILLSPVTISVQISVSSED